MKVHIVCFKEWAHGPKILDDSKIFEDKDMAEYYAKELTNDLRKWDRASYFFVKTMEVVDGR